MIETNAAYKLLEPGARPPTPSSKRLYERKYSVRLIANQSDERMKPSGAKNHNPLRKRSRFGDRSTHDFIPSR
jgi:hypothetical protein